MKGFLLRRRLRVLWDRQRFRQASTLVALVGLLGLSLLLRDLSQTRVFTDQATELSIASGEALLLQTSTLEGKGFLSFRGDPGRVVLVESPAAELSEDSHHTLRKLGAPTPPEGLTEVFFGPYLGGRGLLPEPPSKIDPGCLAAFTLLPADAQALSLRLIASSDPGGRPALEIVVVNGNLSVAVSTGRPAAHPTQAPGCQTELALGTFRLVEEPPTRQSFLVRQGGELTLTFEALAGGSAWDPGGRFEPFASVLPFDIDGLQILAESRPLLDARARETGSFRLTRLALAPGTLEASIHGHFEASGIRRPPGGHSRLSLRLGPIVDRLWQMALASLYLAVFVGLKKAFFPAR